jgi:serine/threonine-protein kinase
MRLTQGLVIAGKYRLERPLAQGGMGALWVARHERLDVPLAIKFMFTQPGDPSVARARFEREARASASLKNQHVVHVQDYGVEGDTPYLVMELLAGEDLGKRLTRDKKLSLEAFSKILNQVAKGLRTAHEAGIVHRDLKPANIFVARVDDEEVIKVLDFGIAKETTGEAVGESTKTGELMGSPHYMSPEQCRGAKDLDHRSDLWSLAVIAFRALTGKLPFGGEVLGAVMAQILADPIPIATTVAPELPPAIDAFFFRGFSRDRERRFQSAREMADAFASVVSGEGVPVDPSSRWTIAPEDPTTSDQPTQLRPVPEVSAAIAADFGLDAPPPRAAFPSIPNDPNTPPSLYTPASLSSPSSGAVSPVVTGATGSPLIHSAPPPASPRRNAGRWGVVAGALAAVALGIVGFTFLRGGAGVAPAAVESGAAALPPASAPPEPSASAAPKAEAPAATAAPTATAAASASAEASATAASSAAASASSARPIGPKPTSSGATNTQKKPTWGF